MTRHDTETDRLRVMTMLEAWAGLQRIRFDPERVPEVAGIGPATEQDSILVQNYFSEVCRIELDV